MVPFGAGSARRLCRWKRSAIKAGMSDSITLKSILKRGLLLRDGCPLNGICLRKKYLYLSTIVSSSSFCKVKYVSSLRLKPFRMLHGVASPPSSCALASAWQTVSHYPRQIQVWSDGRLTPTAMSLSYPCTLLRRLLESDQIARRLATCSDQY